MGFPACQAASVILCLLVTLVVAFDGSTAQSAQLPLEEFRSCVNHQFHFAPTTWDKAVHHDVLPRLFMERAWHTRRTLLGPLTLATHASYDRLFQLRAQCKSWGGPLVVAVHLAMLQPDGLHALTRENAVTVQAVTRQLGRFFQRMEGVPRCQLSMVLLWEVYSNDAARILYPYNSLRNYALVLARTELVSMIDVDLLPSQNLFPELMSPAGLSDNLQLASNKTAVVLPAFETVPGLHGFIGEMAIANRAVHGGKQTIISLVAQGLARPFHLVRYSLGHNCTDYPKWYTSADTYRITTTNSYEPWFILQRSATPWYDVLYRGYFYDKIVYVSALKYMGYVYMAHPRAYIMHRPHNLTSALQSPLLPQLQEVMFAKFMKDLDAMASVHYSPVVDATFMRCASTILPWFPHA